MTRIINLAFWSYLWLSQALEPVITHGDFWAEKGKQFFRLNSALLHGDLPVFIGNAVLPLICCYAVDRILRRKAASRGA
jgi:hypothetical protein